MVGEEFRAAVEVDAAIARRQERVDAAEPLERVGQDRLPFVRHAAEQVRRREVVCVRQISALRVEHPEVLGARFDVDDLPFGRPEEEIRRACPLRERDGLDRIGKRPGVQNPAKQDVHGHARPAPAGAQRVEADAEPRVVGSLPAHDSGLRDHRDRRLRRLFERDDDEGVPLPPDPVPVLADVGLPVGGRGRRDAEGRAAVDVRVEDDLAPGVQREDVPEGLSGPFGYPLNLLENLGAVVFDEGEEAERQLPRVLPRNPAEGGEHVGVVPDARVDHGAAGAAVEPSAFFRGSRQSHLGVSRVRHRNHVLSESPPGRQRLQFSPMKIPSLYVSITKPFFS